MTDVHNAKQRSCNMAAIKNRGNKSTEQRFLKALKEHKITGWKRHKKMIGNPDFVFLKERVVIFTDGCFWHGCKKHFHLPETNKNFWVGKIKENIKRDKKNQKILRKKCWKVLRIWEHELPNLNKTSEKVTKFLKPKN